MGLNVWYVVKWTIVCGGFMWSESIFESARFPAYRQADAFSIVLSSATASGENLDHSGWECMNKDVKIQKEITVQWKP